MLRQAQTPNVLHRAQTVEAWSIHNRGGLAILGPERTLIKVRLFSRRGPLKLHDRRRNPQRRVVVYWPPQVRPLAHGVVRRILNYIATAACPYVPQDGTRAAREHVALAHIPNLS
eukprot:6327119-Prymnesium_polylepis.2